MHFLDLFFKNYEGENIARMPWQQEICYRSRKTILYANQDICCPKLFGCKYGLCYTNAEKTDLYFKNINIV